jgi:hypothetical protein
VNDATRAAQQGYHPATLRLPVSYEYPLAGIVGRTAIGAALLVLGGALFVPSGIWHALGAVILLLLGGVVAASNVRALVDPAWRRIVLDDTGVEIRYGFSRRRYPFLDYSDYRISRLGVRRFLTALPIEVDRSLGERARRVRVTLHDRPAFLTPMPVMGGGAPATLLEWQATLNELRRAAIAAAGLTAEFERRTLEGAAEEARRAAIWRTREQAGARPSRLSRAGFVRRRGVLGLAFFAILLAPIAFSYAVRHGIIALCGAADCAGVDPLVHLLMMIGGPALAIAIFALGHARLMVLRAHDLDEDLTWWRAALGPLWRCRSLERRLSREEGTPGTNRFGPAPLD